MNTCTRCHNEAQAKLLFTTHPGGHHLPSVTQPTETFIAPTTEQVCANCITDNELMLELSSVAGFVLGVLISQAKGDASHLRELEHARTYLTIRDNDGTGRRAALRAVGFDHNI